MSLMVARRVRGDGAAPGEPAAGAALTLADGPYPMGLMAVLATVTMLFAAFTAAVLIRRTGADWRPVALPWIAWPNAALLLVSSGLLELGRAAARQERPRRLALFLGAAAVLGLVFLAGQVALWRMLAARGIFLPTSPHASFLYTLSAVHGAHVLGGLAALGWTLRRALRGAYSRTRHAGLTHAAVYWHFVDVVWIYLLVLLSTL
ncbi:MAG: cytochrome c oxidase subunit 3 [Gemmatimonadetes bacterium]|nr:cytochrome c oxidase subunit 3 [Gemmatimonadota bacterium]